ncbi:MULTISPECIES: FAD-dependent monooxygenase [unclassified Mycolicibacterium]|uniref:FAD-dependent monooxygenase n=1 Tax=unclassified Mycolicibacterium TaxID=2636767 RepID=UPI0012DEB731|nr:MULTISPECIES: FAD-dependent monooxygenase [unclassified Mycolicibacterium]MUL81826.1 monooxygenase [Mycolicibacterium sp. CBMA 329]MUL87592.1 monooxygenase [Mycolicibacterium sp. CBMA 331]MUL99544.1 monooxygenase [Mycolicibacterium sp. CBMA 334]MUM26562.1 monooxygenase [Mycolicibacterium sp. CBMA 295]MUM37889.1 monooxygenase [Mycolicibacterium sp. CBMA 247]
MATKGVLVVGAGPTGLMLACELALGGVPVTVLEERTSTPNITRAFAVHARTLELLDGRGLVDDLLSRGVEVHEVAPPGGTTLDLRELPTRFGMVLIVPQSGTEHVLEERAAQSGVTVRRGAQVVGLRQDGDGVTVELAGGESVSAEYVVGCDGAHSTIRRLVGIDFAGKQYETHILLADVRLASPPEETLFGRTGSEGVVLFVPFGDGWFRAIAWDRLREQAPLDEPVTLDEMRDAFHRIAGDDFGMSDMRWSSRFLSERRQARHYRSGRVFLAGDAAHVHSPLGGQGMNTGLGDAFNLGWKLASAVRGQAPSWLLDSYERERHPVGAAVLQLTDAFNQVVLSSAATRRLRVLVLGAVLRIPRTRRFLAERLSGIGIAYPRSKDEDWLVGRRMADVDCGGTRLYELLRAGKFVLVTAAPVDVGECDVVHAVDHRPELPDAVLVRPDGYVAWASERLPRAEEVRAAIAHWIARSA